MNLCIVIMGPPGAGKSSLATGVAEVLQLPLISTGPIARGFADGDPVLARELHSGDWAPELAMRAEVLARIEAATVRPGAFVLEGFPRKLEQLYLLESVPALQPLYFVLDCDPLVCFKRLIQRGREDDHADAVATRWRAWENETCQVRDLLYNHLIELNGLEPIGESVDQVVDLYQMQRREFGLI